MNKQRKVKLGLRDLLQGGLMLVVTGIALSFGTDVNADVRDDQTVNSAEYNVSQNSIDGVLNLTSKFPQIGLVLAAIVIIGLLVGLMVFR